MHRRFAIFSFLPLMLPLMEKPGEGGGGNGDGDKGKKGEKKKKLADLLDDDEEYQDEFNAILEKRLARDRRTRGNAGGGDNVLTKEEKEELQRLRDADKARADEEAARKGEFDKILNREREAWGTKEKNYTGKLEKLTSELRRDRVRSKLVSAAAAAGAIDPEELADLLERRVNFDPEQLAISVLKEGGDGVALNSEGDPMSIEDLVEGYLKKKPHQAAAADGDSAGAKGGKSKSNAGAGKREQPEIADLEKQLEAAQAEAASGSTAALTRVTQLSSKLRKLRAEKAA